MSVVKPLNAQRRSEERLSGELLRRRIKRTRCSGTAELAVVLVGIIVCLGAGFASLSSVVSETFDAASRLDASFSTVENNSTTVHTSVESNSIDDEGASERQRPSLAFAACAIVLACVIPIGYVVRNSRKTKAPEKDEEEVVRQQTDPDEALFKRRQDMRRIFRNNIPALLNGHLKTRHVMSRQLTVVKPSEAISEVAAMLETKKVSQAIVVGKGNEILGIVSAAKIKGAKDAKKASDVMQEPHSTAEADADFAPLMTSLVRHRNSPAFVPVTSNGSLCGVVTNVEVYMSLQCAFHLLQEIVSLVPQGADSPSSSHLEESLVEDVA